MTAEETSDAAFEQQHAPNANLERQGYQVGSDQPADVRNYEGGRGVREIEEPTDDAAMATEENSGSNGETEAMKVEWAGPYPMIGNIDVPPIEYLTGVRCECDTKDADTVGSMGWYQNRVVDALLGLAQRGRVFENFLRECDPIQAEPSAAEIEACARVGRWSDTKIPKMMRDLDAKYPGASEMYADDLADWRDPWVHDALDRLLHKIRRDRTVPEQSIYALYPPEVADQLRGGNPDEADRELNAIFERSKAKLVRTLVTGPKTRDKEWLIGDVNGVTTIHPKVAQEKRGDNTDPWWRAVVASARAAK